MKPLDFTYLCITNAPLSREEEEEKEEGKNER
jgi:hypothetical protein